MSISLRYKLRLMFVEANGARKRERDDSDGNSGKDTERVRVNK